MKGWRGRRELAPRRSATQLGASRGRLWTDTYVKHTEQIAASEMMESIAEIPVVQEQAPAQPAPVDEYVAPAPAEYAAPAPSVEYIAPAPVVYAAQAPGVVSLAPAPALSEAPAPGVELFSPAPAVFHAPTDLPARARAEVLVGGLQGSVPGQSSSGHRGDEQAEVPRVTLLLRKRTDSKRYRMPPSQPLR